MKTAGKRIILIISFLVFTTVVESGDFSGAAALAGTFDTRTYEDGGEYKYSECPLNTEPFLNMAGYFKSLPQSDNPQTVFSKLHETAKTIVTAQNIIQQMLKKEVKNEYTRNYPIKSLAETPISNSPSVDLADMCKP